MIAMFGLGPTEMVVVGIVAVLLFGTRLPGVARSLGKSVVEFKKGMNDPDKTADPELPDDRSEPPAH